MTSYAYSPSLGKRIEIEELDAGAKPSKARKRETVAFVQVPLKWIAVVSKATRLQKTPVVAILLRYLSWRAKGSTLRADRSPRRTAATGGSRPRRRRSPS